MKTVLKTNLLFICFTLLICFGISAVSYGQAVVAVDPEESASPGVGQQLTIQLKITNGRNVAAYQVGVNFDTSALRYVSAANGNYLPSGAFFAPPQVSGGKVTLTATSVSGTAPGRGGTLASVTFRVVAVKKSALRLTDVVLSDSNANRLTVRTRNGDVVEGGGAKWDVTGDGKVDVLDLVTVARSLGSRNARADTNGDGRVDVLDLVVVAKHLGETVGGTPPPVVTPPGVDQLTFSPLTSSIEPGQRSTLTITAKTRNDVLFPNAQISLSATSGTINPTLVTTDAQGQARATFSYPSVGTPRVGTVSTSNVTATVVGNDAVKASTTVKVGYFVGFGSVSASGILIYSNNLDPRSIDNVLDSRITSSMPEGTRMNITVLVRSSAGKTPLPGVSVSISESSSEIWFRPSSGTTDSLGRWRTTMHTRDAGDTKTSRFFIVVENQRRESLKINVFDK
ncbi:hypothetical protein C6500_10470 [Candidatus Poribacteria bacterium]|nr:MAG: hypothetical protein C6500_10470 [Candidatus Poribacteria bacterium]